MSGSIAEETFSVPQPPRLTLRIGISIARSIDLSGLSADLSALEQNLRNVFKRIRAVAGRIRLGAGELYDLDQEPMLRVLSGLEGGLSRVSEEVELGRDEFDSILDIRRILANSRAALDDLQARAVAPRSAEIAKELTVIYCDLWIVIADDETVRNPTPSDAVVGESLLADIPTLFLATSGNFPENGGFEESLRQIEERLFQVFVARTPTDRPAFATRLRAIFWPPAPDRAQANLDRQRTEIRDRPALKERIRQAVSSPPTSDRERAARYLIEKAPLWNWGLLFESFRYSWTWNWKKLLKLRCRIKPRAGRTEFQWADDLATSYGGLYRSSFVFSYGLGALAVLFAFLGVAVEPQRSWIGFSLELLLILLILIVTFRGRRKAWHQRWMDYRLLAETLRPLDLLAEIGRLPSLFTAPLYVKLSEPHRSWTDYYFHAVVRQHRLKEVKFGTTELGGYQKDLIREIDGQIEYHKNNHSSFERFHNYLHFAGQAFFWTTAVICLVHLYHGMNEEHQEHNLVLDSLPLVLPAFGAALSAILHHGEFEKVASRSRARLVNLTRLKSDAEQAGCDPGQLGQITEAFSEVLVADLVDWRAVFQGKDLEFG